MGSTTTVKATTATIIMGFDTFRIILFYSSFQMLSLFLEMNWIYLCMISGMLVSQSILFVCFRGTRIFKYKEWVDEKISHMGGCLTRKGRVEKKVTKNVKTCWNQKISKELQNTTWSSESISSFSITFALASLESLKYRSSVFSLQRSFSLQFILGQKKFGLVLLVTWVIWTHNPLNPAKSP